MLFNLRNLRNLRPINQSRQPSSTVMQSDPIPAGTTTRMFFNLRNLRNLRPNSEAYKPAILLAGNSTEPNVVEDRYNWGYMKNL